MIRRPPRSTPLSSSAASDVYKRQVSSHLLCRLEIVTDEQRDEYMVVHKDTLAQERGGQADDAQPADEAEEGEVEQP